MQRPGGIMSQPSVSDDLPSLSEPLVPPQAPKPKGARPRAARRAALTGMVCVLTSGIPRECCRMRRGVAAA